MLQHAGAGKCYVDLVISDLVVSNVIVHVQVYAAETQILHVHNYSYKLTSLCSAVVNFAEITAMHLGLLSPCVMVAPLAPLKRAIVLDFRSSMPNRRLLVGH